MKNLSRFDIGMIIAFVVVAILGAGGWYFLSGQLAAAQSDVTTAASEFDTYTKKQIYLPSGSNVKTLKGDIALMRAQLDPIEKNVLLSPKNELPNVQRVDTVAWKQKLDEEVRQLNAAAKLHGITVPPNFYYGFSRYLNQNPQEDATPVLTRQRLAVSQIASLLINAQVRSIVSVQRTYEEDQTGGGGTSGGSARNADKDQLPGSALEAQDGVYTTYPFQVEFESDTESLRKIVDDLMHSPYVFVIRAVTVQNTKPQSPKIHDLESMAGTGSSPSLVNSSPGEIAATQPTAGPQYLFGDETLRVRIRVDLIDWHGLSEQAATSPHKPANSSGNAHRNRPGSPGAVPTGQTAP